MGAQLRLVMVVGAMLTGTFALTACNAPNQANENDEPVLGKSRQALTSEQARVLGFEATSDWSSSGNLGTSSNATEGTSALSVVPAGWTEINSVPLGTLANVRDTLSYDLYLPQTPGWGETRAILVAPSLDMWWTELGRQELPELAGGQYHTISFPMSPELVSTLSGSYGDLTIKLVINAPVLGTPYLLDNLVMTDDSLPDPDPPPGDAESFTVVIPSGLTVEETFLSATDHLSVFSQAHAGTSATLPAIANFGPFTTYLQAEAHAYGNVYSTGPVQLDVKTKVSGFVRTEQNIGKQGINPDGTPTADAPVIDGGEFPQTTIESETISWDVTWPSDIGADVILTAPPTQVPVVTTLAPGAYGKFNIHSRNHVELSTGTYHFDSFNTEPEAQLHLDTDAGPIVVYVRSNFESQGLLSKAPVFTTAGDEAQLFLGFLGTEDVRSRRAPSCKILEPDRERRA